MYAVRRPCVSFDYLHTLCGATQREPTDVVYFLGAFYQKYVWSSGSYIEHNMCCICVCGGGLAGIVALRNARIIVRLRSTNILWNSIVRCWTEATFGGAVLESYVHAHMQNRHHRQCRYGATNKVAIVVLREVVSLAKSDAVVWPVTAFI